MAENTRIEWCDHTVSFWWGCEKVSAACANCYADSLSNRFGPKIWGANRPRKKIKGAIGALMALDRKARAHGRVDKVFINSMSDFFEVDTAQPIIDHNGDPLDTSLTEMRKEAFHYMGMCRSLKFLMLTKRPENIRSMWPVIRSGELWKTDRFWLGTTAEDQTQAGKRIPKLLECHELSPCLYLSCEPLLGPLDISYWLNRVDYNTNDIDCDHENKEFAYESGISWIITGGESSANARPSHPNWFRGLRDQCKDAGVPYLFKQWGEYVDVDTAISLGLTSTYDNKFQPYAKIKGSEMAFCKVGKKNAGRLLDGVEHNGFPEIK